jgi:hypothetical protein
MYSLPHAIFAFVSFAVVVHCCFYATRNSDKSDIEDEEILEPRWILQFYLNLGAGMFVTFVCTLIFDYIKP